MLKQLLFSIFENRIDNSLVRKIEIIIIDNDINKSAEKLVNGINEANKWPNKILYYNHPVKGLANVRNELLNKAFLQNPDFIIFIDDDEFVTSDWLNELLISITRNDADCVRGPVIAKLNENVSKYIAYFFRREVHPDNSQIYSIATGNLILRRESLEKFNVWFDNRFNSIGSEDSFFGIQLVKKGARFYWAANAIAYETIPENRSTLKWLIKRKYNGAVTFTYILKIEKKYYALLKKTLISGAYLLLGIIALPALLFPITWKYWGLLKISESIGGFAGLFSFLFQEYATDR